jgi:hypothetical protein
LNAIDSGLNPLVDARTPKRLQAAVANFKWARGCEEALKLEQRISAAGEPGAAEYDQYNKLMDEYDQVCAQYGLQNVFDR